MKFLRQRLLQPLGRNVLDASRDFRVNGTGVVGMACAAGVVDDVWEGAFDGQGRFLLDDFGDDGIPHGVRFVGGGGHGGLLLLGRLWDLRDDGVVDSGSAGLCLVRRMMRWISRACSHLYMYK